MKYDKHRVGAAALIAGGVGMACGAWIAGPRSGGNADGAGAPGRVVIAPSEIDVSATAKGEAAKVRFTILNGGSETIEIAGITTSCGCTLAAPLKRSTLASGESVDLDVTATPPGIGEKTTYIDVFISASDRPAARAALRLVGEIPKTPRIVKAPQLVIVRGVFPELLSARFTVMADELKGQPEWIERIDADNGDIAIRRDATSEEPGATPTTVRRTYHFVIEAKPTKAGRERLGRLTVATRANGAERRASIVLMGDCKSPIEASPNALFAAVSASQLPKTFQLYLQTYGSLKGKLLEVAPSTHRWMELGDLATEGVRAPFVARLPVTILSAPADVAARSWESSVCITAGGSDVKVEIPVHVRVNE
ncbi:MAG TPA: DUF1573 domain-containing protein [Pirellulales bacterium]|nr:DUF1573 domain-containing protein [Pirellulales bacterium]